jgi:hypothetical protein
MTHYADLEHHGYFMPGTFLRAIGWLSAEHDFPTGDMPPGLVARLTLFCSLGGGQREIGWASEWGTHTCELCRAHQGAGEIAVPASGILYVAPSMISHYVEAHRYAPPGEFVAACMASPLPGTDEYRIAAAPFRRRYEQWVAEQHRKNEERELDTAARWVVQQGGGEDAVQAWKRRYWDQRPAPPKTLRGSAEETRRYLAEQERDFFLLLRQRVKSLREPGAPK